MKALSIRQPFASAILDGPKRVENRPRRVGFREGMWVWVHASKTFYWTPEGWIGRSNVSLSRGACGPFQQLWSEASPHMHDYPRGAILGAMLCGPTYAFNEHQAKHPGDHWAHGPLCTRIEAVMKLSTFYPCNGSLGLWSPPREMTLDARRLEGIRTDALEQLDPEQYEAFVRQLVEGR